jgi:hypothetical protein
MGRGSFSGRADLWENAGPGKRRLNWSYEDGLSLQDQRLFVREESTRTWVNELNRFVVHRTEQTKRGDTKLKLSDGYAILLFYFPPATAAKVGVSLRPSATRITWAALTNNPSS